MDEPFFSSKTSRWIWNLGYFIACIFSISALFFIGKAIVWAAYKVRRRIIGKLDELEDELEATINQFHAIRSKTIDALQEESKFLGDTDHLADQVEAGTSTVNTASSTLGVIALGATVTATALAPPVAALIGLAGIVKSATSYGGAAANLEQERRHTTCATRIEELLLQEKAEVETLAKRMKNILWKESVEPGIFDIMDHHPTVHKAKLSFSMFELVALGHHASYKDLSENPDAIKTICENARDGKEILKGVTDEDIIESEEFEADDYAHAPSSGEIANVVADIIPKGLGGVVGSGRSFWKQHSVPPELEDHPEKEAEFNSNFIRNYITELKADMVEFEKDMSEKYKHKFRKWIPSAHGIIDNIKKLYKRD